MMHLPITEHPHRDALVREIHARPYQPLIAPVRASHLAMLSGEHGAQSDRDHVASLCDRFDVPPPRSAATHFGADLGPFQVRWERHTEFSTFTFFRHAPFDHPFEEPVIDLVPRDWLAGLPGEVMAAIHLALEPGGAPERDGEGLARLFGGNAYVGSAPAGGAARAWSDLRLHEDRFLRILIRDVSLSPRQAGRLAQRLLEISTYRVMALLALPAARDCSPVLRRIDEDLAALAARMANGGDDGANDAALLERLSRLAAEVAEIATANTYRFGAARAYYAIVQRRLEELREERIQGLQTFSEFLERRMAPAMNTISDTAARQDSLAQRAARMASLLQARVEVELAQQSRDQLAAVNRRVRLQIRLQETVEGLSVVAISYYLVGLIGYGLKALKAGGLPVSTELATGIAVPVVVLGVWYGLRRARRALFGRGEGAESD